MLKQKTRVVRLNERGVPSSVIGTVMYSKGADVLVKWDDGVYSALHESYVMPHQQLKAMFKHGPKLRKS